jgi:hypothetical protein
LKDSIGSSVQASLRDAHPFPTIIPWTQAHGFTQSLRDFAKSEMRTVANTAGKVALQASVFS